MKDCFFSTKLEFKELDFEANQEKRIVAYDALAEHWYDYAEMRQPNYRSFIEHLARTHKIRPEAILDLACGTGSQAARLSDLASTIVGVDLSQAMLDAARMRCREMSNVTFVQSNFGSFDLSQRFWFAICASNSLNYVRDLDELNQVFRTVARHMELGGLFVFDTSTLLSMTSLNGHYLHFAEGDRRFVLKFDFDRKSRRERSLALLPRGVELHERIPIDPGDVFEAVTHTGFVVDDYFTSPIIPGRLFVGHYCFFVLRYFPAT
jgi:ubiquinone/menaquinone biosynthesis C-methylase UbiE